MSDKKPVVVPTNCEWKHIKAAETITQEHVPDPDFVKVLAKKFEEAEERMLLQFHQVLYSGYDAESLIDEQKQEIIERNRQYKKWYRVLWRAVRGQKQRTIDAWKVFIGEMDAVSEREMWD